MSLPPVYATREDVMRALDIKLTARNAGQVDRALQSASRGVDGLCHRRFYPETATRSFDWPDSQYRPSWRIWLDDNELISLASITTGGVAIDPSNVVLYPQVGPPYNRVEINLGSSAAWGGGNTHQLDVSMTGLWAGCPLYETQVGALTAAVASTSVTTVAVDGAASALLGVGSVLRIDSERLLVTGRTMTDTGQTVGGAGLTAQANSVTIPVTNGAVFAVDEVLLIDSERMLIVDIAGNQLTVQRAWDGTVLAAHTANTSIYAARTLTVTRGALGTTAATHADAAAVVRWDPPGLIRDLTIAEAMNRVLQEQAGYSRTSKTSSGAKSTAVETLSLESLRTQVYNEHGRKARHRGV
ncbi:hypothetical protein ACH5A7_20835 [Streptomyces sp. NPDC018955]|uniref:hypothetical protein n=1 Tax=Streptomyces sp. NPDC018955 TaxID=3365055 RepID=UPI0037AE5A6E